MKIRSFLRLAVQFLAIFTANFDLFEAFNDVSSSTKIILARNSLCSDRTKRVSKHSRDILEECVEDSLKSQGLGGHGGVARVYIQSYSHGMPG